MKVQITLLLIPLLLGCAKFDLGNVVKSSTNLVVVGGVSGGTDSTSDFYLYDGNIATVNWKDSEGEDFYELTVFKNDQTTVFCDKKTLPKDTTAHTLDSCPLLEGKAYWVLVEAVSNGGVFPQDKTQSASEVGMLESRGGFNFLVPPELTVNSLTVDEDSNTAMVVATLSQPSDWPTYFNWRTDDRTALNSGVFKDYDAVINVDILIPPGETTVNLPVSIDDDPRDEDNQILEVSFSNEVGAKVSSAASRLATLTIVDNDPPPNLNFITQTVTEGGATSAITIQLDQISEKTVSFSYGTRDGTASSVSGDYISIPPTGTTFAPGQSEVSFTLTSGDDSDVCEFDETVEIEITGDTNLGAGPSQTVIIQDNDLPTLSLVDKSATEGTDLIFEAVLSNPCPTKTVGFDWQTVALTAAVGLDLTSQNGSVSFAPGSTSEMITVGTIDDSVAELINKHISIGVRNKLNIDESSTSAALGTIVDDDGGLSTVKVMSSGESNCALSSAGQIKCWGKDYYIGQEGGHLGDQAGEMGDNLPPIDFGTLDAAGVTPHTVLKATSDESVSCVLLDSMDVKCWGYDSLLGLGNISNNIGDDINEFGDNLPYLDLGTHDKLGTVPHKVQDISVLNSTHCALLDTNQVKCWGRNANGQAGYGNSSTIGASDSSVGDNLNYLDLGTGRTVKQLSMPCAILDNDKVKCWGYNSNGDLGLGDKNHRGDTPGEMGDSLPFVDLGTGRTAKKIFANCAILDDDSLKCWGLNSTNGQLGLEHADKIGDGPGEMGDSLPPINLGTHDGLGVTPHHAVEVARSTLHVCTKLDDNRLKCWGRGAVGQTGKESQGSVGDDPGDMGDNLTYVDLGAGRTAKKIFVSNSGTFIIRDDDSLVSFGSNRVGQLGLEHNTNIGSGPGSMGDNLRPVNLGAGLFADSFSQSNSEDRGCAVLNTGALKCWGESEWLAGSNVWISGQKIGDTPGDLSSLPDLSLPPGRTAIDIFGNYDVNNSGHAFCALLDGGLDFVCWGHRNVVLNGGGNNMEIGNLPNSLGANLDVHSLPGAKKIIQIFPFFKTSCALNEELDLMCWGIGNGNTKGVLLNGTNSTQGLDVNGAQSALVGTGRKVLNYTRSSGHACALLDDFNLKCWGDGVSGQLGSETSAILGASTPTSGDNLLPVNLGTVSYPVQVEAGYDSTCVVFANGGLKCFGLNGQGQLGLGDEIARGRNPGDMGDDLEFVDAGMQVSQVYRSNERFSNVCVRRIDNSVVCWGQNASGKLGNGQSNIYSSVGDDPGEMGANLDVIDLNGGVAQDLRLTRGHVCALQTDSAIKCWGENQFGQLGLGDTSDRGDEPGEMGAALPAVPLVW